MTFRVNGAEAPDCGHDPSECRIAFGSTVRQPLIEWTPEYDGHGAPANSDPNVIVETAQCATCGKSWELSSDVGEVVETTAKE